MNLKHFWSEICIETGCDEVGRGCLAGPVVAAAVIIDEKFDHKLINDSKKLTTKVLTEIRSAGFLHSDIRGSALVHSSPPLALDDKNIVMPNRDPERFTSKVEIMTAKGAHIEMMIEVNKSDPMPRICRSQ